MNCEVLLHKRFDRGTLMKAIKIARESNSLAECQDKIKQLPQLEQEAINSMCEFRERNIKNG